MRHPPVDKQRRPSLVPNKIVECKKGIVFTNHSQELVSDLWIGC
jgi:hypothetical protein